MKQILKESDKVQALRLELKNGKGTGASNYLRLTYALKGWREPLFKDRVVDGFRLKRPASTPEQLEANLKLVEELTQEGIPCKLNNRKDVVIGTSTDCVALKWKKFNS